MDVITYGNGQFLLSLFNGIVMVVGDGDYLDLIRVVGLISILWVATQSAFQNKPPDWRYILLFAMTWFVLFVPRTPVVITDRIESPLVPIGVVANVPFGVAVLASWSSRIGDVMTLKMEQAFGMANENRYSSNGSGFYSSLIRAASDFQITDEMFAQDMREFMQQCVFYDIQLGQYSWEDLMSAGNIWTFLGGQAMSPARSFYNQDMGQVVTCAAGYPNLNGRWNVEIDRASRIFGFRIFFKAPDTATAAAQLTASLQSAYQVQAGIAATSADLIRQNMMINIARRAAVSQAAAVDATSAAADLAAAQAEVQQKRAYESSGSLAKKVLPLLRNVIEGLVLGLFPIALLLMFTPIGGKVFMSYAQAIVWLQMWAPLYAIINMMVSFYGAGKSTAAAAYNAQQLLNMSTHSGLASIQHDMANVAGYMAMSVPLIAYALVSGGKMAMSQLASNMLAPAQQAANSAGASVATGNLSYGNVSMGNTSMNNMNANKWDTNVSHRAGMSVLQDQHGGQIMTTPSGVNKYQQLISSTALTGSSTEGLKLSAEESFKSSMSSAMSQMKERSNATAAALTHATDAMTSRGNDTQVGEHADISQQSTQSQALQQLNGIAQKFGDEFKMGKKEAFSVLASAALQAKTPGLFNMVSPVQAVGEAGVKGRTDAEAAQIWNAAVSTAREQKFQQTVDTALSAKSGEQFSYKDTQGHQVNTSYGALVQDRQDFADKAQANLQKAQQYQAVYKDVQSGDFSLNANMNDKLLTYLAGQPAPNTNQPMGEEGARHMLNSDPTMAQFVAKRFFDDQVELRRQEMGTDQISEQAVLSSHNQNTADFQHARNDISAIGDAGQQSVKDHAATQGLNTPVQDTVSGRANGFMSNTQDTLNNGAQQLNNAGDQLTANVKQVKADSGEAGYLMGQATGQAAMNTAEVGYKMGKMMNPLVAKVIDNMPGVEGDVKSRVKDFVTGETTGSRSEQAKAEIEQLLQRNDVRNELRASGINPDDVLKKKDELSGPSASSALNTNYAAEQLSLLADGGSNWTFQQIFGKDIPDQAIEHLRADLQAGQFKGPAIAMDDGRLGGHMAAYDSATQTILVSPQLLQEAQQSAEGATKLQAIITEEYGHHVDNQLRNHYSNVGGDDPKDEGAAFAREVMQHDPKAQGIIDRYLNDEAIARDDKQGSLEFAERPDHQDTVRQALDIVGSEFGLGKEELDQRMKQIYSANMAKDLSQVRDPDNLQKMTDNANAYLESHPEIARQFADTPYGKSKLNGGPPENFRFSPEDIDNILYRGINFTIKEKLKIDDNMSSEEVGQYHWMQHHDAPVKSFDKEQDVNQRTGLMNYLDATRREYINENIKLMEQALERGDIKSADAIYGKIDHALEDVPYHTNSIRIDLANQGHPGVVTYAPAISVDGKLRPVEISGSFSFIDAIYSVSSPGSNMMFPTGHHSAHGQDGNEVEQTREVVKRGFHEVFPEIDKETIDTMVNDAAKVVDIQKSVNALIEPVKKALPWAAEFIDSIKQKINEGGNYGVRTTAELIPLVQNAYMNPYDDKHGGLADNSSHHENQGQQGVVNSTHSQLTFDHPDNPGHELAKIITNENEVKLMRRYFEMQRWYSTPASERTGDKPDLSPIVDQIYAHPHDYSQIAHSPKAQQWIQDNPDKIERLNYYSGFGHYVAEQTKNPSFGRVAEKELFQIIRDSGVSAEEYVKNPQKFVFDASQAIIKSGGYLLNITDEKPNIEQNAGKLVQEAEQYIQNHYNQNKDSYHDRIDQLQRKGTETIENIPTQDQIQSDAQSQWETVKDRASQGARDLKEQVLDAPKTMQDAGEHAKQGLENYRDNNLKGAVDALKNAPETVDKSIKSYNKFAEDADLYTTDQMKKKVDESLKLRNKSGDTKSSE